MDASRIYKTPVPEANLTRNHLDDVSPPPPPSSMGPFFAKSLAPYDDDDDDTGDTSRGVRKWLCFNLSRDLRCVCVPAAPSTTHPSPLPAVVGIEIDT